MILGQLKLIDGQAVSLREARTSPRALERRLQQQQDVLAFGLDPDVLCTIVDEFYARVRAHAILGPLFAEPIGDRWPEHLEKMKSFWISVALSAGTYSGKPVAAHQPLENIQPWHFGIWLGLFRQTVSDLTGSEEAVAFLGKRAERIANTLRKSMFQDASLNGAHDE